MLTRFRLFLCVLLFPLFLFSESTWEIVEDFKKGPSFEEFEKGERERLILAIDQSLKYLERKASKFHFPKNGITHEKCKKSLVRFKALLEGPLTGKELDAQIKKEFVIYRSLGKKETKKVLFTGYFEPLYEGSRVKTEIFKYPLYRIPSDLVLHKTGKVAGRKTESGALVNKYWTRQEIDLEHKLAHKGLEIVYLKDPYEVYMAQLQGSVAVNLPDKTQIHLGYAARNHSTIGFSLPKELYKAGKLQKKELLPHLVADYFKKHPEDLHVYLDKNTSYVFFKERKEAPLGALSVKLYPGCAIATDHKAFPKACLAFVDVTYYKNKKNHPFKHFVLNHDTGGGIRGPGRCDIFFGTGDAAEKKAADMHANGQLYFLFLKD